jgi:pimeloyl-ACP methyl ester carboxylesterase
MPEFKTETGLIHYEVSGPADALPIMLLHNFMSDARSAWGQLIPVLAQHFRVLAPDLPGHGRSQGHPAGFRHREMAEQMAAFMQTEGAAHGHLAGCSSGGMIAQLMVHHKLVQPHTLTLVSTTHSTNPNTTQNPAVITPENFKASPGWMEATAKLHDPYHGDGYYRQVLLEGFRQLTAETAIDLPLETLRNWNFPVCLIHGEQDEFYPTYIVEKMAAALPKGELHIIPGQTHALLFRQPWRVRDVMLDFLLRHS